MRSADHPYGDAILVSCRSCVNAIILPNVMLGPKPQAEADASASPVYLGLKNAAIELDISYCRRFMNRHVCTSHGPWWHLFTWSLARFTI
jgi:hypothetical protein